MSLEINPGYIRVTDTNGHVVHDTRDKIFHVLTQLSGSLVRSSLDFTAPAITGWATRHQSVSLGAVDPACTHIQGAVKIVYAGGHSSLPSGAWYSLSGSLVLFCKAFQLTDSSYARFVSSMRVLSLRIAEAEAFLDENIVLGDNLLAAQSVSSMTVTYKLAAGRFT